MFSVLIDGKIIQCFARRKLKDDNIVLAGDIVDVDIDNCVIENIKPRKNKLIRPPIANIDRIIIVISCVPEADFYLTDKLLIAARLNNIEPILCFNKIDIKNDLVNEIEQQ
jgi:ribosome biogenesis GTPase